MIHFDGSRLGLGGQPLSWAASFFFFLRSLSAQLLDTA
jgi:hypothetical protein